VWVSGKTGHEHGLPAGGVEAQARLAFKKIEQILAGAGATMADVVELVTYHTSMDELDTFIRVKSEFFSGNYPCWTAVGVKELVLPGLLVEIKVTAVIGSGG
jgi:enamine deaminase RidA (YjgF/YER057c/UK114 family)